MTTELEDICLATERVFHEGGWSNDGAFTPSLIAAVRRSDGLLRPISLPVLDAIWSHFETVGEALRWIGSTALKDSDLSKRLRVVMRRMNPEALVLNTEGWSVSMPDDPHGSDQVQAWAADRKLHRHPERVETRVVVGTFLDGSETTHVMRYKGREPQILHDMSGDVLLGLQSMAASWVTAMSLGDNKIEDAIEDALRKIVE